MRRLWARNDRGGVLMGFLTTLALIAVVAIIAVAVIVDARNKSNQLKQFGRDLQSAGYSVPKDAIKWDEETERGRSKSIMEFSTTVAGCGIELEREKGSETFEVDEVYYFVRQGRNTRRVELRPLPTSVSPSVTEVASQLRLQGDDRYPCLAK